MDKLKTNSKAVGPGSQQRVVMWRWRIWRDEGNGKMIRTKETFEDWRDAASRCTELNRRAVGFHWCRLCEPAA
jgi:hypothetical protein